MKSVILEIIQLIVADLLSKFEFVDAKFNCSKISEISGFETFISGDFISSRKCPNIMVDPALDSLYSELFNAVFDVITGFFPADLSRVYCRHPLL